MDNQTIIERLDSLQLLCVCEMLAICLKSYEPLDMEEDMEELEVFWELPDDVIIYCCNLTRYQQLKFLASIANTLAKEEETANSAIAKQLELPV
ncbi:hypothetical protein [Nostoc linckia]|jgi:hypothetical protein|uniref:hypothetical protein n=2 Tax=Nostoc linckia TaxID=92942 RepID=UPI00117C279D|nr:hypothetical protein [Nostoc linckia]